MNAFRHMTRILVLAAAALVGLAVTIPHARACPKTGNSCCSACGEQPPVELCVPKPDTCGEESSSAPVRYLDGVLKYKSPGLHVDGPGRGFSISLGFNNRPHGVLDTDFNCGVNWWLQGVPFLEQRPDGTLVAIWGSTSVAEFAQSGAQWVGRHGVKAGIVSAVDGDQENVFVMQGVYGTKAYFHKFAEEVPVEQQGKVKRIVSPGGKALIFSHCADGVESVTDTNGYYWWFRYEGGLLTGVEVIDKAPEPDMIVTMMELAYYGTGARWGLARDLKSVTITEYTSDSPSLEFTRTAYYAYYTDSARAHRLRFVLDPETYADASSNGTVDLDVAYVEAAEFQAVADYEIDYYYLLGPDRFCVSTENVRSAGCDCTGGRDTGVFRYDYTFQAENPAAPYNSWVTQVEQTNPDNTKKIVRVNKIGAPIDVITEVLAGDITKRWGMRYAYDAASSALTLRAHPNVCVVDENRQITTPNGELVETFTYDATWGALESRNVKNGMNGNAVALEQYTYAAGYPRVATVSTLVDRNAESPQQRSVVSYIYEYYTNDLDSANDAQVRLKTTTLPAVDETENGSNSAGVIRECFHPRTGNLIWTEEKLDNAGAYRVVAYQYGDVQVPTADEGLLFKKVSDPSTTTWNAMKAAMGLDGTVDPPNTAANGLDATTDRTYDTRRRIATVTGPEVETLAGVARPNAKYWHTRLGNGHRVTLTCAHADAGAYGAPVSIVVYDRDGRQVTRAMGEPSANDGDLSNDMPPASTTLEGAFAGQLYERRSWLYAGGQVSQEHVWQDAENPNENTHYKTLYEYNNGMLTCRADPDGTVYRWAKKYALGPDEWPSGYSIESSIGPVGNEVVTQRTYFDLSCGDLSGGPVAREVAIVSPTESITTVHSYDWLNRRSASKLFGKNWVTTSSYDWANRVIAQEQFYDANGDGVYDESSGPDDRRIAKTETYYDPAGRVYKNLSFEADTAGAKLCSSRSREEKRWHDLAGRAIKVRQPTGLLRKTCYDRLGRTLTDYLSFDDNQEGEAPYSAADDVAGDIILEQGSYVYDDAGNATSTTRLSRYHDRAEESGLFGGTMAIPSYTRHWCDVLGRRVKTEERGSTDSATGALVVEQSYTPSTGRLFETTDPMGKKTRFFFDNLGRQTKIVRNYVNGDVAGDDHDGDQTIQLVYGGPGLKHDPFQVIERWTTDTLGASTKTQKTHYAYGVPKGSFPASAIDSGKLLYKIGYADPDTGEPHYDPSLEDKAADAPFQETFAYDCQGRLVWRKGQAFSSTDTANATIHEYTYGVDGSVETDVVTSLRSDAEVTFDRVACTYDNLGRLASVQSKNGTTVVNENAYEYNSFGQVMRSWQEHEGPKGGQTLAVAYGYTDSVLSLPSSITYPDDAGDYTVHYRYTSGALEYQQAGERLGRVSGLALELNVGNGIADIDPTNVVSYEYIGARGLLGRRLEKSGVTIRADQDGASYPLPPTAGYDGIDRFGRLEKLWVKSSSATHNQIAYSYDAASNVLGRDEQAASVPDETYTYDDLHRLASATVSGATRGWTVSLAGNWLSVQDGGTDSRTHNAANEIATRSYGTSVVPLYDKSGSMTRVPDDRLGPKFKYATVKYDAWNRPVKAKDNGTSTVVAEYTYNGLGRVVKRVVAGVTRFFYYDEGWRVLTERSSTGSDSSYRVMDYVWGALYIDELVCRKASATRMDFVQDTNWNVIALLNSDGTVAERYRYDPYGKPTFMNANGTTKTSGILNSTYLFQGRRLIEWKNANVNVQTYHFRNREYLPVLGRFLQRDPIGTWGSAADAGNSFAFERATLGYVDPFGLEPELATCNAVLKDQNLFNDVTCCNGTPECYAEAVGYHVWNIPGVEPSVLLLGFEEGESERETRGGRKRASAGSGAREAQGAAGRGRRTGQSSGEALEPHGAPEAGERALPEVGVRVSSFLLWVDIEVALYDLSHLTKDAYHFARQDVEEKAAKDCEYYCSGRGCDDSDTACHGKVSSAKFRTRDQSLEDSTTESLRRDRDAVIDPLSGKRTFDIVNRAGQNRSLTMTMQYHCSCECRLTAWGAFKRLIPGLLIIAGPN